MNTSAADMDNTHRAEDVPPDPAAMIESMRAFGYSLPAAIADLIDNSISAGASRISVDFHWAGPRSRVIVLDDGHGMSETELSSAMRLGSRSPREVRAPHDLGRFGLGLKTAAFSQGRSLTVASRQDRVTAVRQWDLDHVTRVRSWSLLLDPPPGTEADLAPIEQLPSGTLVMVGNLDQLAPGDAGDENAHTRFLEHVRGVEAHIAMVFHRFLAGRGAITIEVNGNEVAPWDPYLREHTATQQLAPETLPFRGHEIVVQPFVLPYFTKVDNETHREAGGPGGWNAHQGFYVYRARRLLVAGDYLGLPFKQEEHFKLARIQVDLDNAMDTAWQIDVKKATARIPGPLREDMRRVAQRTRKAAAEAYRFRGKTITRKSEAIQVAWLRRELRDGAITWSVNRKHPVIQDALEEAGSARGAVESAFRLVEESVPVTAIAMDASENPVHAHARMPFHGQDAEVAVMLRRQHDNLSQLGASARDVLDLLAGTEPFDSHPDIVAAYMEELGI